MANNSKSEPIERSLFKAADILRKNIDTAEYKDIVLGLIFLKYISDTFKELHEKIMTESKRTGKILFFDTSETGYVEDRTHRAFIEEDIKQLADTYHEWCKQDGNYQDQKGFCKSASMDEITKHNFVLTPGRYVGIKEEEDDGIPFEVKIAELTTKLAEQMKEEQKLNEEIKKQLEKIGIHLGE